MALYVTTGTYVGNGVDNRAFTGIGFQPKALMIRGTSGNGALVTDTMPAGYAKPFSIVGAAAAVDLVESLDADGFTIGTSTDTNGAGTVYYWTAWGGDSVETLSYTGNGTDNTDIALSTGFTPIALFAIPMESGRYVMLRTAEMTGDASRTMGGVGISANSIQSMGTGTFQVGTSANVNATSGNYHALAFEAVAGVIDTLSYTGTAAAHDVTGLDFEPDWLMTMSTNAVNPAVRFRSQDGTTSSIIITGSTSTTAITDTIPTGFTVGTNTSANADTVDFYTLAFKENTPTSNNLYVATGTYTGNGADDRAITGIGFQPKVVWILRSGAAPNDVLRTDTMVGDVSKPDSGVAVAANYIQSLDADGFTVGSSASVNASGVSYYWMAIGGTDVWTTSYTGNATNNRVLTGSGFPLDAVMVIPENTGYPRFSTAAMPTNTTTGLNSSIAGVRTASLILNVSTDGIALGSSSNINGSGVVYHVFGIRRFVENFKTLAYVGNGTSQSLTGFGFQPTWTFVKADAIAYGMMGHKDDPGKGYYFPDATIPPATTGFTSFDADGLSLGNSSNVNQSTKNYDLWAAADNVPSSGSTLTRDVSASAALQSTRTRTTPASAALKLIQTRTVPTSAALQATQTRTASASAAIEATLTRTVSASAAISGGSIRNIPASAALSAVETRDTPASAALQSTLTRTVAASAALQATLSRTVPASVVLIAAGTRLVPASAHLSKAGVTRTVATSAALQSTLVRSAAASAALRITLSRTVTASTALQSTLTRNVPAHASLRLSGDQTPGEVIYAGYDASSTSKYRVLEGQSESAYICKDGSAHSRYTLKERKALA